MIGKKIRNPKKSASKTERITALLGYVRTPEHEDKTEKCVYSGARGFLSDTDAGQLTEMLALAHEAPRSRDPISHYVLSWREDEHPTGQQIERAVDIVLAELGMEGHQVVYALHADTNHDHVHVVVNRVDPESGRVTKQGLDIEALHRAVARIEREQGWQHCGNARYTVREDGTLEKRGAQEGERREGRQGEQRADRERHEEPGGPSMSDGARAEERRTGGQSAERLAQERAAPVIARARSWAELHQGLTEIGMRYERKGSGAIVWVGEHPVKASKVARGASLSALTKRLGPFQPATVEQAANAKRQVKERPEPPHTDPIVAEYRAARAEWYRERRAQRTALRSRHGTEYRAMVTRHREERGELAAAHLRGDAALVGRSLLAQRDAAERAATRERQRKERQRLAGHYPAIDEWRRLQGQQTGRYRDSLLGGRGREDETTVHPRDIRAFIADVRGAAVAYHRGDHRAVFTDAGRRVQVHDREDQDGLVGALQLAAAKWGGKVSIQGSAKFRARAARAAAREGIRVVDADLAEIVRDEQRQAQQAAAAEQARAAEAERQRAAVQAERERQAREAADAERRLQEQERVEREGQAALEAELAKAHALTQGLINDMVSSGDFTCSDAEWARATSIDMEVVRRECAQWAVAALEAGWSLYTETLDFAQVDPSTISVRQDLGR